MSNDRNIFELMLEVTDPSSTATAFNAPAVKKNLTPAIQAEIREDTRNFIQRAADNLYSDPDVGGVFASVADVLPGIPFVDIIDPPDKLVDEGQQNLRNLVSTVELALGLKALPKVAGRVFTNVKTPLAYGISRDLKKVGYSPSKAVKSIIKDDPYWNPKFGDLIGSGHKPDKLMPDDILAARDKPYREMFGLKEREWSKDIYKEISPGVIEFNKKNPIGNELRNTVINDILNYHEKINPKLKVSGKNITGARHHIMGGYNLKYRPKTKDWIYEDKWDFGINKGELKNLFKELQENGLTADIGLKFKKALTMGLRKGVDMITDPVTIRGRIPDSEVEAAWNINEKKKLVEKIKFYTPNPLAAQLIKDIDKSSLNNLIDASRNKYPGGI